MYRFLVLLILVFILPISAYAQSNTAIFKSLKWNNRVLVMSGDESSGPFLEQYLILADDVKGLEGRELIVLHLQSQSIGKVKDLSPFPFQTEILEENNERRFFEQRLGIRSDRFSMVLIGLDGQVKETWDQVTALSEIYDVIDAMPMRQDELNQK